MTQLLIAGVEAVLPLDFSCTVKRENSFFTKNGEYTYDATLRLDNPVNNTLYGFLHRLNKTVQVETNRKAILIADGHVYCRGTEVITRWTDETVTIQIVSGESELNFFIGQDQKIEDLDLGSIEGNVNTYKVAAYPTSGYCCPIVRSTSGNLLNVGGLRTNDVFGNTSTRPMPYLCELLKRIISALGYNKDREMVNHLEDTQFKNLFIVNTVRTVDYAHMVPGWTVKDFLSEVEKLTGVVFVTNNTDTENPTCDILLKSVYYQEARQLTLSNVIDTYEMNVEGDDSREAEFTNSDVCYDLPDHYWCKIMKLPEDYLASAKVVDYPDFSSLKAAETDSDAIRHDTSSDRYYIKTTRTWTQPTSSDPEDPGIEHTDILFLEIDQFKNIDREENTSTLELKITPAPMVYLGRYKMEVIDISSDNGYQNVRPAGINDDNEDNEEAVDAESIIRGFEKEESNAVDLYCAFYSGLHFNAGGTVGESPVAYTDAYHAALQPLLYNDVNNAFTNLVGSLRLKDLEESYYQGGYEIDTRHKLTVETYDPNMADPRQVYVIRNRRYVCRDIEEVITAEGRQKKWKMTCYPITITDEAIEKRWILTKGVWDDGAAWLDDGRWNDSNPN